MFPSHEATYVESLSGISGVSFSLELSCHKITPLRSLHFDHAFATDDKLGCKTKTEAMSG